MTKSEALDLYYEVCEICDDNLYVVSCLIREYGQHLEQRTEIQKLIAKGFIMRYTPALNLILEEKNLTLQPKIKQYRTQAKHRGN